MRSRPRRPPVVSHYSRWEYMTGWGDELEEEDAEHSAAPSDGDILGDVKGSAKRRRGSTPGSPAASDETWELDTDAFVHGTVSIVFLFGLSHHMLMEK